MKLLLALALLASPAGAIMPERNRSADDARRYGLDALSRQGPRVSADGEAAPIRAYNRSRRGLGPAALAAGRPAPSSARAAAEAFLREKGSELGIDADSLRFERASDAGSHRHAMFRQVYRGLNVEFARVKVHFDASWGVIGIDSDYDGLISLDPRPTVPVEQARAKAVSDAGGGQPIEDSLVVLDDPAKLKPARLAWRVRMHHPRGRFRYYIDARTGQVAFRVDEARRITPCARRGRILGQVYELDPTDAGLVTKDFVNQRVFVGDGSNWADTQDQGDADAGKPGVYCAQSVGKIFTQLQGPFVSVASHLGPSVHHDNGNGVWNTIATPVSSPHPYSDNTVHTSTIDLSGGIAPGAVKFLPVFTRLEVGGEDYTNIGGMTDADSLQIVDQQGRAIANYTGTFSNFKGAAVPGQLMRLRIKSNEAGVRTGYDVGVSSYLTLTSQYTFGTEDNLVWVATHAPSGLRGEILAFYHLNQQHDYLSSVLAASSHTYLGGHVNAMAHVGPNLVNAFYEPTLDALYFGDVTAPAPSDVFMEDGTVPRHEYTHYFVEKIYSPQNFGQAGAISEAVADYYGLSSFGARNWSSMGRYVALSFGSGTPLRELDCPTKTACRVLSDATWVGEIHDDSIFLGQALWDIRKARISLQGQAAGSLCADRLVYNTLLFFPESFQEFLAAMLRVDQLGTIAAECGGAAALQSTISSAFADHGLILPSGTNDPYDVTVGLNIRHNDGFETSVAVGTSPQVQGTVFPAGDLDFFSFAAGRGRIKLKLDLPPDNQFYKGYFLRLFDADHRVVAEGHPPYDGFQTDSGYCKEADCTTSKSFADLDYYTDGGLFFVQIGGGPTVSGDSNSGVNSTGRYTFTLDYARPNAFGAAIVTAQLDGDVIRYDIDVTSWPHTQDWSYSHARLLDHNQVPIAGAVTDGTAGSYLADVAPATNALGRITGQVRLQNNFSQRYPSLGTVHLEVFGKNVFYAITGSTASLGTSNALNLTTNSVEVKAWNNVFDPTRGQKTTIKYDVRQSGNLRVRLYTMSGKFVSTLFDGPVPAGKGTFDWNGRNFVGSTVASGIYLVRIDGPGLQKTMKIAVVK